MTCPSSMCFLHCAFGSSVMPTAATTPFSFIPFNEEGFLDNRVNNELLTLEAPDSFLTKLLFSGSDVVDGDFLLKYSLILDIIRSAGEDILSNLSQKSPRKPHLPTNEEKRT
mmetsp:Transcript_3058/g.4383  ORF Transcript_3058/g.4383 Transcript_3058/m.4383 type:complete len:112 (-) Transcript_3058:347-682(-)